MKPAFYRNCARTKVAACLQSLRQAAAVVSGTCRYHARPRPFPLNRMTSTAKRPLRLLALVGTRPECLKMAALVRAAGADARCRLALVGSGQHPAMIRDTLAHLGSSTDLELPAVIPGSSLSRTVQHIQSSLIASLPALAPDVIIVQGDTSTAYAGALAARAAGIPLAHVEAGLRTGDPLRPFPEEPFRRRIAPLARWHFAPTAGAAANLIGEGIDPVRVLTVGNTIVDELKRFSSDHAPSGIPWRERGRDLLVLTLHRRENYGSPLVAVCTALLELLEHHDDLVLVCPVHPNPAVGLRVRRLLGAHPRCLLTPPIHYPTFVRLLREARLVVTDSGGIQEEAPYLGVPVLVARDATERPEALSSGGVELVGSDRAHLLHAAQRLLQAPRPAPLAFDTHAPFGDGNSAGRILQHLIDTAEIR